MTVPELCPGGGGGGERSETTQVYELSHLARQGNK